MRSSLSLFGTVFALRGAYAAIYTDPAQLPARDYDYVIVGGMLDCLPLSSEGRD